MKHMGPRSDGTGVLSLLADTLYGAIVETVDITINSAAIVVIVTSSWDCISVLGCSY
jgi:hypothetical protein